MKVLSIGPDPDLVMRNSGDDRKPGVHLSDITKRMVFERDRKLNPENPIDAMVLERGFTWEFILERALAERHQRRGRRPEQLQEDGIWMSPDWVDPDDPFVQLEEWKATKKTSNRSFSEISWTWMPNTMSYLRKLLKEGICKTLRACWRIWFINGDYSYESKNSDYHLLNEYYKVVAEFTERELEENWQSIVSHGHKYGLLKDRKWDSKTDSERSQSRKPRASSPPPPRGRARKAASKVQPPSRGKARIVTFPSTRTTRNRASAS